MNIDNRSMIIDYRYDQLQTLRRIRFGWECHHCLCFENPLSKTKSTYIDNRSTIVDNRSTIIDYRNVQIQTLRRVRFEWEFQHCLSFENLLSKTKSTFIDNRSMIVDYRYSSITNSSTSPIWMGILSLSLLWKIFAGNETNVHR